MKRIAENLYRRGKIGSLYCRIRIPKQLRSAFGKKGEFVRCLHTSDLEEGKVRRNAERVLADALFAKVRSDLQAKSAMKAAQRITQITDQQMAALGAHWVSQVLFSDELQRRNGLDEQQFEELGDELSEQRRELGRLLAQGQHAKVTPALQGFMHLCGIDADLPSEEVGRLSYTFLQSVVSALDARIKRQDGEVVLTSAYAPTSSLDEIVRTMSPKVPEKLFSWREMFDLWNEHVPGGRPKPTRIAMNTTWRDLECFCAARDVMHPGNVTPELVCEFVDCMAERLAVTTLNDRLAKIKHVYSIAVGKLKLSVNPAEKIIGRKEGNVEKRQKKRIAFDEVDVQLIFGSEIYTQHLRSQGQAGEASYWIPLVMFYTGARPEEIAGLAIDDIVQHPVHGWYFDILDRPEPGEEVLLMQSAQARIESPHSRTVKNEPSIRKVPVAQQLIDLGLLRYVEYVRGQGLGALFPTLKKDSHDKLSGAFGKFFGRYRIVIGLKNRSKTLYSLRHTMKNLMVQAQVPSKYLKRLMGHTSGDGHITDGYGDDLPLEHIFSYFRAVKFPSISALPWQPGLGFVRISSHEKL